MDPLQYANMFKKLYTKTTINRSDLETKMLKYRMKLKQQMIYQNQKKHKNIKMTNQITEFLSCKIKLNIKTLKFWRFKILLNKKMIKLYKQTMIYKIFEANLNLKEDNSIQTKSEILILLYSNYFKNIKNEQTYISRYSNLKGDDGDPNNTILIQIKDEDSHDHIENSIKQTLNKYNKCLEPNIFSLSNCNSERKELRTDTQKESKAPRLIIQNITDSDKLIEITTTDHVDKEEPVKPQKGMLGLETVEYQKRRIKFRNPTYEFKERQKKLINWKSAAMKKWKINLSIVLFVVKLEKKVNHKQHQAQTISQENDDKKLNQSENRVKKICISILKLMFGLFLAVLISFILLPFILISDLFLRIYTYISLYIKYALSYDNKCYRVILLMQIYVYALAIIIAIITNLYQTLITTVELIYNIVGTIQNNISNLSRLLFYTINTPFSKQK